ncbi:S9 family peptidase [Sandaracinobacteroides saxicola]|uniref:Acyl-peptide hydrolase n=1 Tax=Sandaracinobacteroides saxicola TaxID=2759707 RepID=A0A7G5IKZ3_9SPHN|nr:S9 family peptidase [Sandaracinobacteroides saxicola]QMW24035.1 S9 family peptidase [Sandaracinobacteroides saxicola]
MRFLTGVALLLAAGGVQAASAYEPADLYRLAMVTDPVVAPDGRRVLYTRASFDISSDRRQNELWLATLDAEGRLLDQRLLVPAATSAGGAVFSPDGSRIAFVGAVAGKPQLFILALADGIARPLGTQKTAPQSLAWSPDGSRIAFGAQVDAKPLEIGGMPAKPEGATWAPAPRITEELVYRRDGAGWVTPGAAQLFVIEVATAKTTQLTSGDTDQINAGDRIEWTRDGRSLLFSAYRGADADLRANDADLWLVPAAGGAATQLTSAPGIEASAALSPDGRRIAYIGGPDAPKFYAMPELWLMDAKPGAGAVKLSAALDRPILAAEWAEDGRSVLAFYNDEGVTRVARIGLDGRVQRVEVPRIGGTRLYLPSSGGGFGYARGTFAYTSAFTDRPAGLGVARGGRQTAAIDVNAGWAAGKRAGRLEEINVKSRADGRRVQGWLLYPPDFDPAKKYPLILDIHGGPNTDYGPFFSVTHALYAARGFVVLFTNPRGSIGYGEAFANAITGAYPGQDHDDLMSAVDEVAKRPFVDGRNLFITGGSGGGVLTLWGIGKEPDKFRAAAALRPVTDWALQTYISDIGAVTWKYWLDGKAPWDDPVHYYNRSPVSLAAKWKTPTLLVTGESDFRTPIAQTEQVYGALKLRGVPARMVRLPEAPHGMGRPSQWLQSNLAVIDWFEKWRVK